MKKSLIATLALAAASTMFGAPQNNPSDTPAKGQTASTSRSHRTKKEKKAKATKKKRNKKGTGGEESPKQS
jgi:hypothetical protein